MDAILASALGAFAGAIVVAGFFWWSMKKRPHWYAKSAVEDTAFTLVIVGLVLALFAIPIGRTYFLLWMIYAVAIALVGYGCYHAVLAHRERKVEKK